MKTRSIFLCATLAALLALPVGALAGEVSQGKTIAYDETAKTIKIEEYDTNFTPEAKYGQPTGIISEYDLAKAKVGIIPENGDVVRIAYDINGQRKVAIKVMNVSKQDLRKK
jgi:hypothetical protein